MTTFSYVALDPAGKRRAGFIDAQDRQAAMNILEADGRFVVELQAKGETKKKVVVEHKSGRISRSDIALFTRRLADLSSAGLPLDRVLNVLSEQSESAVLTHVAEAALEDVRTGLPVSDALAKHSRHFSEVYTQTLRAGEASGQFPQTASRLADFQEMEVERRTQIGSALVYPTILASTAVLVVVFLLTFVVPRLASVFKNMGDQLPLPTKILLATTGFLTNNYLIVLGILIAAIVGYRAWVATEQGAYTRDAYAMRLPLMGSIVQKAVVSRYSRVLGTLVYGGVPILEGLRLAGLAAGNRVFRKASQSVLEEVRDGRPIATAMRDANVFPPVLTHMVAIGEETGDLPKMLGRVSDSMDFEVDQGLRRLTAFLEPVIVLVMGFFVAFVVLSVLLPIYQAQSQMK